MVRTIEEIDQLIDELDYKRMRKIGYNPRLNQEIVAEINDLRQEKRKILERETHSND